MKRIAKAVLFVLASEAIGNIGTVFAIQAIPTWYAALAKPQFTPPNWLFGPVWTVLFALMGIAAFLVYDKGMRKRKVRIALSVFSLQFALNVLWTILFFGLRSTALGLIDILALWIAIAATIVLFCRVSRAAALLLIPYIAWVSVATLLNYYVFVLS